MYDFCFTPIYAVLLAIGGVAGYITKGSIASLGAGLSSAALLGLMSRWSLDAYHKGEANKTATLISLLIAAGLTYVMYERYSRTGRLMPAGLTAGLSAAMTVFYVWSLLLGPTPKPKARD
ncbi:transmembrane proteins 14C-domain-containing protein [Scenedesmus sp. NREL 46B-D3]|nr:transmembrane proteins 14C-domain-containing protein [Scenedesmus sp. NREL 46B-D3]